MKKCILTFCVTICIANARIASAELDTTPSLSIGSMIDVMVGVKTPRVAMRGWLISELVQNYDCYVQTRWHGLEIATELKIDEMTYIDSLRISPSQIQSADYVISSHYFSPPGKNSAKGFVYCADINSLASSKERIEAFEAARANDVPEIIAKTVGRSLSLSPRNATPASTVDSQQNKTWVVLPFLRCKGGWGTGSYMDTKISEQIEEELLRQKAVKNLVDRKALSLILKEHSMTPLTQSTHGQARMLARMAKADLMLTGQVAPVGKDFRIDLFLIDCETGSILEAITAENVSKDNILTEAIRCTIELTKTPLQPPALNPPSEAKRRREAEILISKKYFPDDPGGAFDFARVRSELESMINGAEGAYLLMHDDDTFVYNRIVQPVVAHIKQRAFFNYPRQTKNQRKRSQEFKTLPCIQRVASLINSCGQAEGQPNILTLSQLLTKADMLRYAGRNKEAIVLAKDYLSTITSIEQEASTHQKGLALEILAECNDKLGKIDEAYQYAKQSIVYMQHSWITHDLIAEYGDRKKRETLKKSSTLGSEERYEVVKNLMHTPGMLVTPAEWWRYLALMREVEGPEKSLEMKRFSFKRDTYHSKYFYGYFLPNQTLNTAEYLDAWPKSENNFPTITFYVNYFHIADCFAKTGRKNDAARICKNLVKSLTQIGNVFGDTKTRTLVKKEAQLLLAQLESDIGPVECTQKPAREARLFDGRHHIYLIPLSDFDTKKLHKLASEVAVFFGSDSIRVLPAMPVPKKSKKGEYAWDVATFFMSSTKDLTIPNDALHLVYLTKSAIEWPWFFCPKPTGQRNGREMSPSLISCYVTQQGSSPAKLKQTVLATRVIGSFRHLYESGQSKLLKGVIASSGRKRVDLYGYNSDLCRDRFCLFSMSPVYWQMDLSLAICPSCQEEYKKADFDKMHSDLMAYLKKSGAKIVDPSEVEFTVVEPVPPKKTPAAKRRKKKKK